MLAHYLREKKGSGEGRPAGTGSRTGRSIAVLMACVLVLLGVTEALADSGEESVFAALHRMEGEAAAHAERARELGHQVRATDEQLDLLEERRDIAERAARPIRQRFERVVARWESALRETKRPGGLAPGESADTRILMEYAASEAIRPAVGDIDVLWRADSDARSHGDLVRTRGRMTVRLAQHAASKEATEDDREELVEEAKKDPKRVQKDMKQSDQALHSSLGRLLKNETTEDFHRKKGTLLPPVSRPPAFTFGPRKQKRSMSYVRHTGLTYRVPEGTEVRAAAAGLVVYAERFEGFGNLVILDHGSEYHTVYAHLQRIDVELGDRVSRGDAVGPSGASGSLEGPKLYFELRHEGEPVDPADWFIQQK